MVADTGKPVVIILVVAYSIREDEPIVYFFASTQYYISCPVIPALLACPRCRGALRKLQAADRVRERLTQYEANTNPIVSHTIYNERCLVGTAIRFYASGVVCIIRPIQILPVTPKSHKRRENEGP